MIFRRPEQRAWSAAGMIIGGLVAGLVLGALHHADRLAKIEDELAEHREALRAYERMRSATTHEQTEQQAIDLLIECMEQQRECSVYVITSP